MKTNFYFRIQGSPEQPIDEMGTIYAELDGLKDAATHAISLSRKYGFPIVVNKAGEKNYHYYDAKGIIGPDMTCGNCGHWRCKTKGWGICDNTKNKVKAGPLGMIRYYLKDDPTAAEELARHVEDGIRYPEDFGCIFFEAWKAS